MSIPAVLLQHQVGPRFVDSTRHYSCRRISFSSSPTAAAGNSILVTGSFAAKTARVPGAFCFFSASASTTTAQVRHSSKTASAATTSFRASCVPQAYHPLGSRTPTLQVKLFGAPDGHGVAGIQLRTLQFATSAIAGRLGRSLRSIPFGCRLLRALRTVSESVDRLDTVAPQTNVIRAGRRCARPPRAGAFTYSAKPPRLG